MTDTSIETMGGSDEDLKHWILWIVNMGICRVPRLEDSVTGGCRVSGAGVWQWSNCINCDDRCRCDGATLHSGCANLCMIKHICVPIISILKLVPNRVQVLSKISPAENR